MSEKDNDYSGYAVLCQHCGVFHRTDRVEFLNIEEDIQGCDVMTFTCPKTGEPARSRVFYRPAE